MPFVVKNTFICEVEEVEEVDGAAAHEAAGLCLFLRRQRRARTQPADCSGSGSSCSSSSDEHSRFQQEEDEEEEENGESSWGGVASLPWQASFKKSTDIPSDGLAQTGRGRSTSSVRLAQLLPCMPALAFQEEGVTELLAFIEVGMREDVVALAQALRGRVQEAARSPQAHRLLESFIHHLGKDDFCFVLEELLLPGHDLAALAVDSFGSSVFITLLIFASSHSLMPEIIERAFNENTAKITHHKHGHKVAMAVLDHGSSEHHRLIVAALVREMVRATRHRFAAVVAAEALLRCSLEVAFPLASAIASSPGSVMSLACHCFGVQVVRPLLRIPHVGPAALEEIQKYQRKLQKDKFGADLLAELGIKGPIARRRR